MTTPEGDSAGNDPRIAHCVEAPRGAPRGAAERRSAGVTAVQIIVAVASFVLLAVSWTEWQAAAVIALTGAVAALSLSLGVLALRRNIDPRHLAWGSSLIARALLVGAALLLGLGLSALWVSDRAPMRPGEVFEQLIVISSAAILAVLATGLAFWVYRTMQKVRALKRLLEEDRQGIRAGAPVIAELERILREASDDSLGAL